MEIWNCIDSIDHRSPTGFHIVVFALDEPLLPRPAASDPPDCSVPQKAACPCQRQTSAPPSGTAATSVLRHGPARCHVRGFLELLLRPLPYLFLKHCPNPLQHRPPSQNHSREPVRQQHPANPCPERPLQPPAHPALASSRATHPATAPASPPSGCSPGPISAEIKLRTSESSAPYPRMSSNS